MPSLTRRRFTGALLAATALTGSGLPSRAGTRTVIVGGGPAGASAALALRAARPGSEILLIERDPTRNAGSPGVMAFSRPDRAPALDSLRRAGVNIALDEVTGIDWRAAQLQLFSGRTEAFDRLMLAPGTAPVTEDIPGLDAHARHLWPAAWGSRREAQRLAAQLSTLPERGHLVLRLPAAPSHREVAVNRALDLAEWMVRNRPEGRMTVLDGASGRTLANAFYNVAAPRALAGRVAWMGAGAGGTVLSVDAARGLIETDAGRLRADVVNFVPPCAAGRIAVAAALTDETGWCPCDGTGASLYRPEVMVLGDARRGAVRTVEATALTGVGAASA